MIIRKAEIKDIPSMVSIYEYARNSMKEAGIDQWQDGAPNAETAKRDIENGLSIVVEEDGVIFATAAAYVGTEHTYDKIYDGKWLTDNKEFGVIHRIAVSKDSKRGGLATKVMDHTADLAKKASITSLRCDTHKDNIAMQKAMLKYGFEYCGVIIIDDGTERFAYEKLL